SVKKESARAGESLAEPCRAGSRAFSLALIPVLGCADKHFDQIVVQAIKELALKGPLELRMIQIARVHIKQIGMHGYWRVLEVNDYLDCLTLCPRRELQQRVLVETQLLQYFFQPRLSGFRHDA